MVSKSPLVQKNVEARIAKTSNDHDWAPPTKEAITDHGKLTASSNSSSPIKAKSPIVQNNLDARIAKRNAESQTWVNVPKETKPHSSKLATTYVRMPDERNIEIQPSTTDVTAVDEALPQANSTDYSHYNESDEDELARREDLVNARYRAEEGPAFFQVLAFMGGIAMIFTSIKDFQFEMASIEGVSPSFVIISVYTWMFGIFICGLEGRALMLNISSLHTLVSNYLKIYRFMWGRGLFYIFVGSLQFCLFTEFSVVCGYFMMGLGLIMFIAGIGFKIMLNGQLNAIPKDSEMQARFEFFDTDHDGYIDKEQFRDFAINLGLHEYEEIDFDSEFRATDTDNNGLISYPELRKWVDAMNYRKQSLMAMFENAAHYLV